jgi:hypothetical protein
MLVKTYKFKEFCEYKYLLKEGQEIRLVGEEVHRFKQAYAKHFAFAKKMQSGPTLSEAAGVLFGLANVLFKLYKGDIFGVAKKAYDTVQSGERDTEQFQKDWEDFLSTDADVRLIETMMLGINHCEYHQFDLEFADSYVGMTYHERSTAGIGMAI